MKKVFLSTLFITMILLQNSIVNAKVVDPSKLLDPKDVPIPKGKTVTLYKPRTTTTFPGGNTVIVCGNSLTTVCATLKGISDATNTITVTTFNDDGVIDQVYVAVNVTLDEDETNGIMTITIIPD
jgi:hypothetical protein